jgi:hypothetical protein
MNKYILIAAFGLAGGFIGEEIGVQCIKFLPNNILFSESFVVPLFLLVASFAPFIVIASILIFRMEGYASYFKGFIFSLAYYLPFQYKAIYGNYKQPNIELSETFTTRVLITVTGTFLLSGIYYAVMKYHSKIKNG